jgi:hypothetical protein
MIARMAWQLRQVSASGAMACLGVGASAAAGDPASTAGTKALKPWHAAQWIVSPAILPSWILVSVWHSDCPQVSSEAVN